MTARHPGATPRRSIVMEAELWEPLLELAAKRDVSASWIIRQLVVAELAEAREAKEIPKRRRTK